MSGCCTPLIIFILIHLNQVLTEPICGTPTQLTNGHISPMKSAYSAGENVTYVCNPEYLLISTNQRTCQDDGSWSRLQPHCKKKGSRQGRTLNQPTRTTELVGSCNWISQLERPYLVSNMIVEFINNTNLNNTNVTVRLKYVIGHEFSSSERSFVLRTSSSQNAIIGNTGYSVEIALASNSLTMNLSSPLYIKEMSLIFNQTETCPVVNNVKFNAEDVFDGCSTPPIPLHSIVEYNNSHATYSCMRGYQLFWARLGQGSIKVIQCLNGVWEMPTPLCKADFLLLPLWVIITSTCGIFIVGIIVAFIFICMFLFQRQKKLNRTKLRIPTYVRHRVTVSDDNSSVAPDEVTDEQNRPPMPLTTANQPPNNEKLVEDLRRNLKRARENTEPFQVPTSPNRYAIEYTRSDIEIEMTEDEYLSANAGNDENLYYSGDAIYANDEIMNGNTLDGQEVIYNNQEPIYGNI